MQISDTNSHPLGLRGRYRTMILHCRRWRFGLIGIAGFRAAVTPRLSGSIALSRWSHRSSIALQSMSCRKGTFRFHLLL
jgi:hypothetical protein